MTMIIDFHTHVAPPDIRERPMWRGDCPMTIETVLETQKIAGIDQTVISYPYHELREMDGKRQLEVVQGHNRFLAALQEKHESVVALAMMVPHGGDRFLREFERAVRQDGCKGAIIMSSLQGHYPDDDDAFEFFRLATELDVPVFIHPPAIGFGEERMREYRLASSIGRPTDGALAISRMIVRGLFEKLPTLKLVASHLGGGICEMIGRMDYAYNLREEAYFLGPYEPLLIKHPPSYYLKMMYLESTCYHLPAARCAVETVGPDHFIFGTDAPPLKWLKKQGVQVIKDIGLSPADEEKVFSGNVRRLLKI